MNIETLKTIIEEFESQIVDSGFSRDLEDFVNSIATNQNNIVALRTIASDVYHQLEKIENSDLPELLPRLLVKDSPRPFTESGFVKTISSLISDTEIEQDQFFVQLEQILNPINQSIKQNIAEVAAIKKWITPYVSATDEYLSNAEMAIISIIFKDSKTIKNLKEFTKTLSAWNKILPIYHQILKSDSPQDIEIATIQNGSIDFVVNIDVDVAINLVDLFTVGFKCYAAYLSYKKLVIPITETYLGNKALEESEKVREKELLKNIPLAIEKEANKQHKQAAKADKKIEKNVSKKVEQITNLVTAHIIRGNDIKLLSGGEPIDEEGENKVETIKAELDSSSLETRKAIKELPEKEHLKLIAQYGEIKEDKEGK